VEAWQMGQIWTPSSIWAEQFGQFIVGPLWCGLATLANITIR
jgi:hypothetical protein